MATGERQDPFPSFNFVVQLIESDGSLRSVAGFSECTGLESTLEVEEYQEGTIGGSVDPREVRRVRRTLGFLNDRRPELYARLEDERR